MSPPPRIAGAPQPPLPLVGEGESDGNIRAGLHVNTGAMRNDHAPEESQHPGVRRALRRDAQRQKARQGMRVGARPDTLHPVTVRRVKKLTKRR